MPVHHGDIFIKLERLKKAVKQLPVQIGAVAQRFFISNWEVQGWQGDNGVELWAKRKDDTSRGRGILVGKGSGHLRKGLKKFVFGNLVQVKVVGVAAAYADIHNFGGTVHPTVTPAMRKFAWYMYFKLAGKKTFSAGKTMGEHSKWSPAISDKINFWKWLALTKKTHLDIKIPKRQFIGNSKQLDKKIGDLIEAKRWEALTG